MSQQPWKPADLVFHTAIRIGAIVFLGVAIWFWPVGPPEIEVPPSFDCGKAALPTEKAICTDPSLAQIDAEFAVYYQDNLQVAVNFGYAQIVDTLEKGKLAFLGARDRCGTDKWCIEGAYRRWDGRLADLVGEPHRGTLPPKAPKPYTRYLGAHLIARTTAMMHGPTRHKATSADSRSR